MKGDRGDSVAAAGPGHVGKGGPQRIARHLPLALILALGLAVRIYALLHTVVINPDGPIYIYQARLVFSPSRNSLTNCGVDFLSIYPYLIWSFHHLFGDWVTSARLVSLFFGTALLLPAYLLLRQFFDRRVSLITLLAFALVPIMVHSSVDVVRDPIAWFFLLVGVLLVVLAVRHDHQVYLVLALAAFGVGAWARVDCLIFIPATALALALLPRRKRLRSLLWFCGPPIVAVLALLLLKLSAGNLSSHYRLQEIFDRANLFSMYAQFREDVLGLLPDQPPYPAVFLFLLEARRFAWLIAVIGIVNRLFEAFSYGFAAIFFIGLYKYRRRMVRESLKFYFPLLCGFSFMLLYAFMLESWVMEYRYTVSIIIGGLVILGVGVEWLLERLEDRFRISGTLVGVIVGVLIFLSVAPKLFQDRGVTEVVFREAAKLAARHNPEGPVRILTSREHVRLVSFYANQDSPVPQCPQSDVNTYDNVIARDSAGFLAYMRQNGMGFFLWEKNNWAERIPLRTLTESGDFQVLGHWTNPQTGRMILYRFIDRQSG